MSSNACWLMPHPPLLSRPLAPHTPLPTPSPPKAGGRMALLRVKAKRGVSSFKYYQRHDPCVSLSAGCLFASRYAAMLLLCVEVCCCFASCFALLLAHNVACVLAIGPWQAMRRGTLRGYGRLASCYRWDYCARCLGGIGADAFLHTFLYLNKE